MTPIVTMRTLTAAVVLTGVLSAAALAPAALAPAALAQSASKSGRYTMSPADGGGFARLDTETGEMSLCTRAESGWSCQAMADDSARIRDEIAALKEENTLLKAEIKRLDDLLGLGDGKREALPPRADGGERGGPGPMPGFRLPTEKEVDQALDYFTGILKKFQDRLKKLEENQEPESKGTPL